LIYGETELLSFAMLFAVLTLMVASQLVIKARALVHAADASGGTLQYVFAMLADIRVLGALSAVAIAGACWIVVLEKLEISYAYPFMALSFVLIPLGASLLFGEPLPPVKLVGVGLIILGVVVSALVK
jgi:multidrug transporter EmrE-like cation transporter